MYAETAPFRPAESEKRSSSKYPLPSSGTPRTRFPIVTPRTTAIDAEAPAKIASQPARQRGSSSWERTLIATPRRIKSQRTIMSGK